MKRLETIEFNKVKSAMLHGPGQRFENASGFCVYVDPSGSRLYVIDEETKQPVLFDTVKVMVSRKVTLPFYQSSSMS